jgi:lipopolysaccharide transport system ATP-binding protein
MSSAIKIEGLGKKYAITQKHIKYDQYNTLAETLYKLGPTILGRLSGNRPKRDPVEEFWALQDINLEIQSGERVGIVGRNGAGKSTLLKILSQITTPTTGRIKIHGSVSSLLEVGTGFHPELTGRENIFLNGAILGMTRDDIRKRFDEIVAFSEIEHFLDTPVKRYSSGMRVRLAFSVAAHLEPDILVVDEVLSVGDFSFQQKCLGKIDEVSNEGRTIILVSHNLAAVENICSRAVFLSNGKVEMDDVPAAVILRYLEASSSVHDANLIAERTDRQGSGAIKIVSIEILNADNEVLDTVLTGQEVTFRFGFESTLSKVSDLDFSFTVRTNNNQPIFRNRTVESGIQLPEIFPAKGFLDCHISSLPLTSGQYEFGFRLVVNGIESDYITGRYAGQFTVADADVFGTGKISSHAPVVLGHDWRVV